MTLLAQTTNFRCTINGLYQKYFDEEAGKDKWGWISRAIYLSKAYRLLDTGEVKWVVHFECNDGWQTDTINRVDVTERNFTVLLKKGADVTTWKTKVIINYLIELERNVPFLLQHQQLGWIVKDGDAYYAHNGLVAAANNLVSEYIGELNIKQSGSYKRWLLVIQKAVVGHAEMELAISILFQFLFA